MYLSLILLELFQPPLECLQLTEWQVCPEKALERQPKARCQPSNPQRAAGAGWQVGTPFISLHIPQLFLETQEIFVNIWWEVKLFFYKKQNITQPRIGEKKPRMGEKKPRLGGPQKFLK